MQEAPLPNYLTSAQPEAFRLLVLPPFRLPIVVRLDVKLDGSGELEVKAAESRQLAARLTVDPVEPVTKPQTDRFLQLFNSANFWLMSTQDVGNIEGRPPTAGVDRKRRGPLPMEVNGVVWVVEAAEGTTYHAVTRTSPKAGPFRDVALFLLMNLARIDLRTLLTAPQDE
jgi:hypothetical protein